MPIPADTSIDNGFVYQIATPGSLNAGAAVDALLGALPSLLSSAAYIAAPLAQGVDVSFVAGASPGTLDVSFTVGGQTTTLANASLNVEGRNGFTFNTAAGGQYYYSNGPISGTAQLNVQDLTNLPLIGPGLAGLTSDVTTAVGVNATVFVGAGNSPLQLDGQVFVACFVRGTRIMTPLGERPVEELEIGDLVTTASGDAKPVLWLGRRSYDGAFIAGHRKVLPVRVAAHALGADLPTRDLHLSPCHALMIDGALVPAGLLVNGSTITQASAVDSVEYFHIELEDHDIVLVEGVGAETFVDHDSRGAFQNVAEYHALYPERRTVEPIYAARRLEHGEELERVRRQLSARAAQGLKLAA